MGYPVAAYRNRQRSTGLPGGFQNPGAPAPANDNWRDPRRQLPPGYKPPTPANDNVKKTGRYAFRGVLRRLNPWFQMGKTAYQLYDFSQRFSDDAYFSIPAGWNLYKHCISGGDSITIDAIGNCTQPQVVAKSKLATGYVVGQKWFTTWTVVSDYNPNPSFSVCLHHETYNWIAGGTPNASQAPVLVPGVQRVATPAPWNLPVVYPAVDPLAWPVGQPAPSPRPLPWRVLPYRQVNPHRSPSEQSQWGNGLPAPRPRPSGSVVIAPGVTPSPHGPPHGSRTPGPGVKERKVQVGGKFGGALFRALNTITESLDVIDAIYDALPNSAKVKTYRIYGNAGRPGQQWADATPQQKLWAIYRNLHLVDIDQALLNILANQLQDFVIGKAGRHLGRQGAEAGSLFGYGVGPTI